MSACGHDNGALDTRGLAIWQDLRYKLKVVDPGTRSEPCRMITPEPPAEPQLEVTWDPNNAQSNLARHGVSFSQAASVLLDALVLTVYDEAHSEFEERWFTLGVSARVRLPPGPSASSIKTNPVEASARSAWHF